MPTKVTYRIRKTTRNRADIVLDRYFGGAQVPPPVAVYLFTKDEQDKAKAAEAKAKK